MVKWWKQICRVLLQSHWILLFSCGNWIFVFLFQNKYSNNLCRSQRKWIFSRLVFLICVTQQTQNICMTFVQCWTSVEDVGPTLYKCYTNVLCLLGSTSGHFFTRLSRDYSVYRLTYPEWSWASPSKHEIMIQCCCDAGSASTLLVSITETLGEHVVFAGSCTNWVCHTNSDEHAWWAGGVEIQLISWPSHDWINTE